MKNIKPHPLNKKWEIIKNQFVLKYSTLIPDESHFKNLPFDDKLCRQLGVKLGKTRAEIINEIRDWRN